MLLLVLLMVRVKRVKELGMKTVDGGLVDAELELGEFELVRSAKTQGRFVLHQATSLGLDRGQPLCQKGV